MNIGSKWAKVTKRVDNLVTLYLLVFYVCSVTFLPFFLKLKNIVSLTVFHFSRYRLRYNRKRYCIYLWINGAHHGPLASCYIFVPCPFDRLRDVGWGGGGIWLKNYLKVRVLIDINGFSVLTAAQLTFFSLSCCDTRKDRTPPLYTYECERVDRKCILIRAGHATKRPCFQVTKLLVIVLCLYSLLIFHLNTETIIFLNFFVSLKLYYVVALSLPQS